MPLGWVRVGVVVVASRGDETRIVLLVGPLFSSFTPSLASMWVVLLGVVEEVVLVVVVVVVFTTPRATNSGSF